MDVYQCIRSRLTVRSFKPDAVPEGVVRRMLQAALEFHRDSQRGYP